MSKKEGYIVDLNRMYRYEKDGSFPHPVALMVNGKEYYAAFANGSLCYNKAFYQLYLEDTELVALASGEVMEKYVAVSTKTDFDGTKTPVEVTDTLTDIQPNYSLTEEKKGTFSVTQKTSNFTLTGTYRQRKDSYHDEYYDLRITYIDCPVIPASGEARPLTVYYSATVIRRYESGKVEQLNDATGSTTSFSSVTVNTQQGASFNHSTGWLSASNLGTEEKAETVVATVTSVSISAYGMSLTWKGSQAWKQEANVKTAVGDASYNVALTVDGVDEVLWDSTYVLISATATKTQNYIYTSNPDKLVPETTAATGTITASGGATVSPTSITGTGKSVKLSFDANSTTSDKTYKATLTAGGKKAEATVTQQAAKEEYYWEAPVATGLGYGQIPASGAAIPIYVNFTQNYIKKIGYNTSVAQAYNSSSVAVSLTGSKPSGSTATVSGGSISATSLGTTETSSTKAQYNITGGTYKAADGNTYNFSLTGSVVQEKNVKTASGSPTYNVSLTVDGVSDVLWSSTYVNLVASATKTQNYIYTSNPDKLVPETTATTGTITATGGATVSPTSITGTGKSVKLSFDANSTTSGKTYTATLAAGGKTATATVTQQAAKEEYYWEAPTATSLGYGQIPASGAAISIYVNFTQNYIKKVGYNTSVSQAYNSSSVAISLTGYKPNNSSTAVVSGGTIKANSLGTTLYTSTTPQYNITGGTYKAADGNTYSFSLSGTVYQATNTKGTVSTSYSVGLSPSSRSLGAAGGTVYFTVSAVKTDSYTWSSGSPGTDVSGGTASITTTGGTINPSSVSNGGSLSFYKGENTSASALSYTITASYQGKTATATVSQAAATFQFDYATPGTVGSSGGVYKVYVNSYMNGNTLTPTAAITGSASVTSINTVSSPTAGNIEIVLNIPANTGAARSFTLTVTQPHSGSKLEIKLNQAKYEAPFSLSLASGAYFKKTATNTYQFYGTINVQSNTSKTVYADWYYTVIGEEGMPMGRAYKDTKGTQTLSITSSTKTISYTGNSVLMNETSSAGFEGFRVELRDSSSGSTYFSSEVYTIK